jgi:chromosome segregation ATPase
MGYHTDGIDYDDFTERSCEICHVHGSDSQKTNLNSNQLKKLQNRLDALDREKLELMRNNALCNQEKLSSSTLLENCKTKLQTELGPLQSQILALQTNITGTTSLLNLKIEKLTQCEADKNDISAKAGKLQTDLDICEAQKEQTHQLIESISTEKTELETNNQDLNYQLTAEKTKNSQCQDANQKLDLEAKEEKQKSVKCLVDLGQANQQIAELQSNYNDVKEEAKTSKENLQLCRKSSADGSITAEKEIERIQTELDACSQLQTKCNGDLAKVTLERDTLKEKGVELDICNANLRNLTQERDYCKVELEQSKNDFAKDLEQLRGKNQQQGSEIITLKEQIGGLIATNKTLTNSFKACSDNLTQSINSANQKDNKIDDLAEELKTSEQQNKDFKEQLQTCQDALSSAQKAKLDGYISSCNLMHERYQRYYEGATQEDASWWETLTDLVKDAVSWFHNRYDDTKPIWKESSLKALLCLWQEEGIVRSDAMIKAKTMGGSEKIYSLDDLCNKKQLLDTIEDDILNPCGINDGLWDSSF